MKGKLTCIISAYNEENRIGNVLKAVCDHPLIDETIVIDDGSSDGTKRIAEGFKGIIVLGHKKNKGKTFSILNGFKVAKNDLIMCIDADLEGLSKQDLTNLVSPVIKNHADISISLRRNSLLIMKLIGLDYISGERVFHRKVLGDLNQFQNLPGYGFEPFFNKKIIEKKLKIRIVNWTNVANVRKAKKIGFFRGMMGESLLITHIIRVTGVWGVISQNLKMLSLRV